MNNKEIISFCELVYFIVSKVSVSSSKTIPVFGVSFCSSVHNIKSYIERLEEYAGMVVESIKQTSRVRKEDAAALLKKGEGIKNKFHKQIGELENLLGRLNEELGVKEVDTQLYSTMLMGIYKTVKKNIKDFRDFVRLCC